MRGKDDLLALGTSRVIVAALSPKPKPLKLRLKRDSQLVGIAAALSTRQNSQRRGSRRNLIRQLAKEDPSNRMKEPLYTSR